MIEIRGLSAGYPDHCVLRELSFSIPAGRVLVLAGPNGCGKSTLLRTICGLHPAKSGEILIDRVPIGQLSPQMLAQKVSYLAQSRHIPNITARRMVLFGRYPYLSYPRRYRKEDLEAAQKALQWADAADLADRLMPQLSGGQQQKVFLAMALAQDADTILLDEPTAWMDVRHQLDVMQAAHRLAAEGKAVVMVLHDLCLSLKYADLIAVLSDGQLMQLGAPDEIYTSGILERVFSVALGRIAGEKGWLYYYQ